MSLLEEARPPCAEHATLDVTGVCPVWNDALPGRIAIVWNAMVGGADTGISASDRSHDRRFDGLVQRTAPRRNRLMIASRTTAPTSDTMTD